MPSNTQPSQGVALPLSCDVTDRTQVARAVEHCESELGPVDLLVANAGMGARTPADGLSAARVEEVFSVNFFGAVYAVEAVLSGMLQRRSGHLVAISSVAGFNGLPGRSAYSASKAAMTNFFESLRLDLRGRGVDVTVISPGFVRTPMTSHASSSRPFVLELDDALDRMMPAILARRPALAFPFPVATLAWMARSFPRRVYDALAGRARRE